MHRSCSTSSKREPANSLKGGPYRGLGAAKHEVLVFTRRRARARARQSEGIANAKIEGDEINVDIA